jgi:large conductance mechanosensitive channel
MGIVDEFKTFLMRGNVIDLAVGVVIGGAFGKIVSSLVDNVIMPPIGILTGGIDFSQHRIVMKAADAVAGTPEVALGWGLFVNAMIQFVIIGAAIFMVVKAINKAMPAPPPPPPAPVGPTQEELLAQILDELKKGK